MAEREEPAAPPDDNGRSTAAPIIIPLILGSALLFVAVLGAYVCSHNASESARRAAEADAGRAMSAFEKLWEEKNYPAAEREAARAAGILDVAKRTPGLDKLLAAALRGQAMAILRQGDRARMEAALACLDRSLEISPADAVWVYQRAVVLSELGRNREALEGFSQTIELNQFHAAAYAARARLYRQEGNELAAEKDLNRARQLGYAEKPGGNN